MADKTVTLYVDTQNIMPATMDASCDFGQNKSVTKNKDYSTKLNLNKGKGPADRIIWKASPKAKGNEPGSKDRVEISAIWCDLDNTGVNVLGSFGTTANGDDLYGIPNKVATENYTIYFTVYNQLDDESPVLRGVYFVDPKIEVNP